MGFLAFLAAAGLLAGVDCYFTYKRFQMYGSLIELNPMIAWVARNVGPKEAVAALGVMNLGLLVFLDAIHSESVLHMFVGAKLALAGMQIKSFSLLKQFKEK